MIAGLGAGANEQHRWPICKTNPFKQHKKVYRYTHTSPALIFTTTDPAIAKTSVMDEEIAKTKKVLLTKSKDSKRSRQVNEQEAEDYLKRPVHKISNPNKDLKNAYGKKYLDDPKFNYIHKLKQIRKTGEDSVSEHGDTDDEDFDVNEISGRGNKKKQPKRAIQRKTRNMPNRKGKQQPKPDKSSQKVVVKPEKEEKDGTQSQESGESSHKDADKIDKEIEKDNAEISSSKVQELPKQSNQQQLSESEKESKEKPAQTQQYLIKNKQPQKEEEKLKESAKIVQKKAEVLIQEEEGSQNSQSSQKDAKQNQGSSSSIKDDSSNDYEPQSEIKLTFNSKASKKKGKSNQKSTSKQTFRINKSLIKTKRQSKENVSQGTKFRNATARVSKFKGKATKIQGKSKNKEPKKVDSTKAIKQQVFTQRLRTRGKAETPETTNVKVQKAEPIVRLAKKSKPIKNTQEQNKEKVADSAQTLTEANHESKQVAIKTEETKEKSPKIETNQQKMLESAPKITNFKEAPKITVEMKQSEYENILKQQTEKAIKDFIEQRRKSLKLTSRVVIESLFYFERIRDEQRKHGKPKKYKYQIIESSEDEPLEILPGKRKGRLAQKEKFKRYRKIVVEDSGGSEGQYQYVSSKKHKKQRYQDRDEESQSSRDRIRLKKRRHRHAKDSSGSDSYTKSEIQMQKSRQLK